MEHRPDSLTPRPPWRGRSREAFTLLELLVVVAIMVVLYLFTLPAVNSMLTSYRIGAAGDLVAGTLASARQSAIALNQSVEVRFYRYAISGIPGEQPQNPSTGKFRAVQLFAYNPSGVPIPITKAQQLPDGIIIDSGTLSPVLSGTGQPKAFTATDPQVSIPEASGTHYLCADYDIYPGGTTSLSGQQYLTIHRNLDGDPLMALPKNFEMIQVDPLSATVRTYKP